MDSKPGDAVASSKPGGAVAGSKPEDPKPEICMLDAMRKLLYPSSTSNKTAHDIIVDNIFYELHSDNGLRKKLVKNIATRDVFFCLAAKGNRRTIIHLLILYSKEIMSLRNLKLKHSSVLHIATYHRNIPAVIEICNFIVNPRKYCERQIAEYIDSHKGSVMKEYTIPNTKSYRVLPGKPNVFNNKRLIDHVIKYDESSDKSVDAAVREFLVYTDDDGNTAIHVACRYGHIDVLEKLVEVDLKVLKQDKERARHDPELQINVITDVPSSGTLSLRNNAGQRPVTLFADMDIKQAIKFSISLVATHRNVDLPWLLLTSIDPLGAVTVSKDVIECEERARFLRTTDPTSKERNVDTFDAMHFVALHYLCNDSEFMKFMIQFDRKHMLFDVAIQIVTDACAIIDTGQGLTQFFEDVSLENLMIQLGIVPIDSGYICEGHEMFSKENDYRKLIYLSVISGRHNIAEILAVNCQVDAAPVMLICTLLLDKILQESLHSELKSKIQSYRDVWQNIARRILQYTYSLDKSITIQYVGQPLPHFGNKSVFDLALQTKSTTVLSLPCFDRLRNTEWWGPLADKGLWYRGSAVCLPILNYILVLPIALFCTACTSIFKTVSPVNRGQSPFGHIANNARKSVNDVDIVVTDTESKSMPGNNSNDLKNQSNEPEIRPKLEVEQPDLLQKSWDNVQSQVDDLNVHIIQHELHADNFLEESVLGAYGKAFMLPATKMIYHEIAHILFLGICGYMISVDLKTSLSVSEISCFIYMVGYTLELVRLMYSSLEGHVSTSCTTVGKLHMIDVGAALTWWASAAWHMGLSISQPDSEKDDDYRVVIGSRMYVCRLLYAVAFVGFSIQLIVVYSLSQTIGIKLKMIYRMFVQDMIPFMVIISIVIITYMVVFVTLLYPNGYSSDAKNSKIDIIDTIVFAWANAFYALIGEYELDTLKGQSCEANAPSYHCPHKLGGNLVLRVFLVIYFLVGQILMLNLLIAMFSKTADLTNMEEIMHSVSLVEKIKTKEKFREKSIYPPPMNIIAIILSIPINLLLRLRKSCTAESRAAEKQEGKRIYDVLKKYALTQAAALRNKRYDMAHQATNDLENQLDACIRKIDDRQIHTIRQIKAHLMEFRRILAHM